MIAGNNSKIKTAEQNEPIEILKHILAVMASDKPPTIKVDRTKIEALVKIV